MWQGERLNARLAAKVFVAGDACLFDFGGQADSQIYLFHGFNLSSSHLIISCY